MSKKICIIGAGIGGLTAGALLLKKGYDVTFFEKQNIIGGRALTINAPDYSLQDYKKLLSDFAMSIAFSEPSIDTIFEKGMLDGYHLDLGYHAIGGGVLSNTNSVLSDLGSRVDIIESKVGFIDEKGYVFPFLSNVQKLMLFPFVLRLVFAGEKTMKRLDSVSMTETIRRYGRGRMQLVLEVFSRSITTINNLDMISTGEMFRAQKNLLKGSKPVGYPKGGLVGITQKFGDYIVKDGGVINFGKTVEKVIIEDKTAKGVVVDGEEYFFDAVVSNVLVQHFFDLVDEKEFPKEYVEELRSLKGTGSLCAYYSLKNIPNELVGKTFHFIERDVGVDGEDAVGMIDFMASSSDAGVAPIGSFLVQSYIICSPDEAKDKKILEKLRMVLDKYLNVLIPGFKSDLNWAIYPSVWHLDGVSKTIERDKPEIKTPVKNLYFVGDCVKAPGIGFNCAVNSGRVLSKIL